MKWKYFFIIISCILFGFVLGFLADVPQEYTVEIGDQFLEMSHILNNISESECPNRLSECEKICFGFKEMIQNEHNLP